MSTDSQLEAIVATTSQFLAKTDMRIINVLAVADGAPQQAVAAAMLAPAGVDALIWYPY